jgi:flagellar motor switch protein FliM
MFRIEHNVETGEITQIELTQEEIDANTNAQKEQQIIIDKMIADKKIADDAKVVVENKLKALGLTADDLKALLS